MAIGRITVSYNGTRDLMRNAGNVDPKQVTHVFVC